MDAQLLWNNDDGCGDIAFVSGDFKRGKPIESAVFLSLFCDARAKDYASVVDPDMQRGWWGDLLNDAGHKLGSNIWQLERETLSTATLNMVKGYCELALKWMIDDQIVDRIEIDASLDSTSPETTMVVLSIILYRGDATVADIRFKDFWDAQIVEGE
jgi:phage gp46-like protein